ncbi:MAG: Lrp/AsnC family transcriptional regulator [Chloroflexi bacterium]|nr:Lrp/AsnC family transcriptional regulator [Chloroflexota bacterium]
MSETPNLDAVDVAILNLLKEDGRRSLTVIAHELNMSISAIRNRLTRLMEQGTLRIIGKVDPYHVGWNAPATIEISTAPGKLDAVVEALVSYSEVTYVASISGEYNLMLDIMCRDNAHLYRWIDRELQAIDGVQRIKTTITLKIHKYATAEISLISDADEETS